jgi:hypothetical protein
MHTRVLSALLASSVALFIACASQNDSGAPGAPNKPTGVPPPPAGERHLQNINS